LLEVGELAVEVIKLGAGGGDFGAALEDAGQEVDRHVVTAAVAAHGGEAAGLLKVDPERAERNHDADATEVCLVVFAVSRCRTGRLRQDALSFVEAEGAGSETGAAC
jgi:hypothetical protein